MIRRRDYLRLTTQKLGLRKRRAAFAIFSVALGAVVVVTVNSLMAGVRDVAVKTIWTEEIDPDVVRIYVGENPFEYVLTSGEQKEKETKRMQFLTESVFDEIRGWPGVEAADRPVVVQPVSISSLDKRPRGVVELQGVPEALLMRYVTDRSQVAGITNAIPLVVGEREVRLRFDEKHGKLEEDPGGEKTWLGRDVTIVLGDNYARLAHFNYDYAKREYKPVGDDDVTAQHDSLERNYGAMYDMTIFNTTLTLKGRVVGFCPGNKVLIPFDAAELCEKWIDQRNRLAARIPPRPADAVVYGPRGQREPKPGEYTEGVVLVKHGADVEADCQADRRDGVYGGHAGADVRESGGGVRQHGACRQAGGVRAGRIDPGAGVRVGVEHHVENGVRQPRGHRTCFGRWGRRNGTFAGCFLAKRCCRACSGRWSGWCWDGCWPSAISHWVIGFARRSVFDPEEALLIPDSIFSDQPEVLHDADRRRGGGVAAGRVVAGESGGER
jgi:hypothetical protein